MATPPLRTELSDTYPAPNNATARSGLGKLWDYATGLLGSTGNPTEARAALKVGDSGMKNRIINASGLVGQRSAPTLTASYQYSGTDRFLVAAVGGTGVSGTATSVASANMQSGYGVGATGASWTSGAFSLSQRIEWRNCIDMRSKTVTVSGKVEHDFGSSRNFVVSIYKANAQDNFAGVTLLGSSTAFACASGAATAFSYSLALGASDCDNGLMVLVQDSASNTVVSKKCMVGDLQLEIGAAATALEVRSYGVELALCQRYYETMSDIQFQGYSAAGTVIGLPLLYKQVKRVSPSVSGTFGYSNASGGTISSAGVLGIAFIWVTVTSLGNALFTYTNVSVSAEL